MKKRIFTIFAIALLLGVQGINAQALRIPQSQNLHNSVGRRLAATDINIEWSAPAVRGREGKIWGTPIAHYGYSVLGFGSNVESPWRAGADECTKISFSTDVTINGKMLPAGKYAFFIAVYEDSCVLIFNKNTASWGSYFYRKDLDVLHVKTVQKKNQQPLEERLAYRFENQTVNSVDVVLAWEYWKIPFSVQVDVKKTTLANIQAQMSGELGFDVPSLTAAANWCLQNEVNYEQALNWINSAIDPSLGGNRTFNSLSTKAQLLEKMGKGSESEVLMKEAVERGTAIELHQYGRQLLNQKKPQEAIRIFELNHKRHNGAWPTNVGMMRGYSALGDYKKALEYAKLALSQAPDDLNKQTINNAIKQLESGKAL